MTQETLIQQETIDWFAAKIGDLTSLSQALLIYDITDAGMVTVRDGDTVRYANRLQVTDADGKVLQTQFFALDGSSSLNHTVKDVDFGDISSSAIMTAAEAAFDLGLLGTGRRLFERSKIMGAFGD